MNPYRLIAVWPPITLGALAVLPIPTAPAPVAAILGAFALLMVFDARARLAEFNRATEIIRKGGEVMLSWRHRGSWCQREMIKAAAATVGRRHAVSGALHAWGYRWYHIFPDGSFERDSCLLKVSFWTDLLGIKRGTSVPG